MFDAMHGRFQDLHGDTWQLRCDPAAVERVRITCGIDLESVAHDGLAEFRAHPLQVVGVLTVLLEPVLKILPMTAKEFGNRMNGATAAAAAEAIGFSLIDHGPFPESRKPGLRARFLRLVTAAELVDAYPASP